MDYLELMQTRHSCRSFEPTPVENTLIDAVLELAARSPSACNSQPWKVIVVNNDNKLQQLIPLLKKEQSRANGWVAEVSTFLILCETRAILMPEIMKLYGAQYYAQIDTGIFCSSLILAAQNYGLGTCITGQFDEVKIKESFSIPDYATVRLVVAIGYEKDDTHTVTKRKPLDKLRSYNVW